MEVSEAYDSALHAIDVDEIQKYRRDDSTVMEIHNWLNNCTQRMLIMAW